MVWWHKQTSEYTCITAGTQSHSVTMATQYNLTPSLADTWVYIGEHNPIILHAYIICMRQYSRRLEFESWEAVLPSRQLVV